MKITKIEIFNLYELFNYNIDLGGEDDLTILTGPNGYGKTTILNIIFNLFNKHFHYFQKLIFDKIIIIFENNQKLEIVREILKSNPQKTTFLSFEGEQIVSDIYTKEINVNFNLYELPKNKNLGTFKYTSEIQEFVYKDIERFLPIRRFSQNDWIDRRNGKVTTINQIIEENKNVLPKSIIEKIQKQGINNDAILNAINSINVYLIKEQRLIRQIAIGDKRINSETEATYTNTIEEYSKELSSLIRQKQVESLQITQELDSTFPKRLMECNDNLTQTEFEERFSKLTIKQTNLQKFGLSNSKPELTVYNTNNAKVLSVYLNDSEKKASVFDDLLEKIELFVNILNNKRFTHKTINIDSKNGFSFRTSNRANLNLTDLSSGEQQEVVLLYELLFKAEPNTLVLIDEPEISLHVTWQKDFINDLLSISKIQKINILIATHSPQIINDRWDLTKDLFDLSKSSK